VIHSKSKQLHFNLALNECDLKRRWTQMKKTHVNMVSNEHVTKERGIR